MPLYRAQVVLKHQSGIPANHFANTLWFEEVGAVSAVVAERIAERVRDTYIVAEPSTTSRIVDFYSDAVATLGHEVRMAPIDEVTGVDTRGPGQPPLHVEVFDILSRVEPATNMPSEVAVCVSFRNASEASVPVAQRRGRAYIGPFISSVSTNEGDGITRPSATLLNTIRGRFAALRSDVVETWVVYSRPFAGRGVIVRPNKPDLPALPARPGAAYVIDQVWTDDAFDTQRRRGEPAAARTFA